MSLLHIGLAGPVAGMDVAPLLGRPSEVLPHGYEGAPFLVQLARRLAEAGHRVSLFTTSSDLSMSGPNRIYASEVLPGLTMVFCPSRARGWRPVGGMLGRNLDLYRHERAALQAAMCAGGPDVIHAHWAYEFAWAALDSGLPTVVTGHDSPLRIARMNTWAKPTISLHRWLRALMAWRVLRRARHVTVVSPYMQQELSGMTRHAVTVVPNPADGLSVERGRDRSLGPAPRLVMVSNGWDRRKNAVPALLAFARCHALQPSLELHLYGHDFQREGPAHAWCAGRPEMAAALPAIHFHGAVPHAEMMAALERMDLLLHPSLEESFGMVLVEAMALGLPVVAGAESGAVPWVVRDERCLCDVTAPLEIARAVSGVLQAQTYAALSRSLRAMVSERFDGGRILDQYRGLYLNAVQDHLQGDRR